jgi:tryptophanase
MEFFLPAHQGRACENIISQALVKPGHIVPMNYHFTTTKSHIMLNGGTVEELITDAGLETTSTNPFKGNMDIEKLEALIREYGAEKIGLVVVTVTNNSAGGQPVSVQNVRETAAICKKYGIKLCIDAARYAENAFFVKQREEGYADKSIKEIVKEMFSYADMFTMSAKKDTIVNMGGLIGIKDNDQLIQSCKERTILFEGFITYGGLSGRELESLAIGLYEGLDEDYLRYRIGQLEYLAGKLDDAGITYQ